MRTSIKTLALAAAVLVSLTACDKPKPEVTVFSGARSVHAAAECWMSGDGACTIDTASEPTVLPATSSSTLGISVDSDVAEVGWRPVLVVNGQEQQLTTGVLHRRYWRMAYPEVALSGLEGQPLQLIVYSTTDDGQSVRGYWNFSLTNDASLDNA